VIGPRWLTRLTHRKRWARLDALMDAEVRVMDLVELWRTRAETATGEKLWHFNYLAALSEQVADDAAETWMAIHGGRWSEAVEHSDRMVRHTEELEASARELVAA
jgi:hypothetical protein